MAKWFSCCTVFNELDMLELRLETQGDAVDTHVWVEAGMTHSGVTRQPLVGQALAAGRFAAYEHKIIYHYLPTLPGDNSWPREAAQRAALADAVRDTITGEDWFCVSDADEIVRADEIAGLKALPPGTADAAQFELAFYYYAMNFRVKQGWGVGACRWNVSQDANAIRRCEFGGVQPVVFQDGGWHLSYFGDAAFNYEKVTSFLHHDWLEHLPMTEASIRAAMEEGMDLWRRDLPIEVVAVPDNLPPPMVDHPEKYVALGWLKPEYLAQRKAI